MLFDIVVVVVVVGVRVRLLVELLALFNRVSGEFKLLRCWCCWIWLYALLLWLGPRGETMVELACELLSVVVVEAPDAELRVAAKPEDELEPGPELEEADEVDEALDEEDELGVVVEAKLSKVVVESTANSVGEPTSSKLIELVALVGPTLAVEVTEEELKRFAAAIVLAPFNLPPFVCPLWPLVIAVWLLTSKMS